MFFVIREAAGWFLVVAALYLIQLALLDYVQAGKVVEAGIVVMASMFVFKGGIHLIRVATAARICMHPRRSSATGEPDADGR